MGFKLAGKPADEKHPFGHARIEYLSGVIVSFIVLFLGLKLLAYFLVMLVILFLMTVCGNTQKLFVSFAGVLGISSVLYWGIPENSWLSVFKYVNIMGSLHTGDMMAVYRNIGLYGFPVSYITVSIVVCVIAGDSCLRQPC